MQTAQMTKRKHGGLRKNAGRPKGTLAPHTLEKQFMARELQQQVFRNTQQLVNTQLALAYGSIMFFRKEVSIKGDKEKVEYILVTDPEEIKRILDENGASAGAVGEDFYVVQTVPPDARAIENLLDRGFGKPTLSVEMTSTADLERHACYLALAILLARSEEEEIPDAVSKGALRFQVKETSELETRVRDILRVLQIVFDECMDKTFKEVLDEASAKYSSLKDAQGALDRIVEICKGKKQ